MIQYAGKISAKTRSMRLDLCHIFNLPKTVERESYFWGVSFRYFDDTFGETDISCVYNDYYYYSVREPEMMPPSISRWPILSVKCKLTVGRIAQKHYCQLGFLLIKLDSTVDAYREDCERLLFISVRIFLQRTSTQGFFYALFDWITEYPMKFFAIPVMSVLAIGFNFKQIFTQ